jgi:hypothetical protein
MNILNEIKKLFGADSPIDPAIVSADIFPDDTLKVEQPVADLFYCYHCHEGFVVTDSMQFPISVPKLYDNAYFFQGIGISCPFCHKDNIFG